MNAVTPLLAVRRLMVHYPLPGPHLWSKPGSVRAVDGVDFNLQAGETLGIVGESGCGKSTLARTLVGLQRANGGAINYEGHDLAKLDDEQWRPLRRDIQMVFQDPLSSLDPRMNIGNIIAEPLEALYPEIGATEREARVGELLEKVGLSRAHINRYPHEFSGGQCQRVGIARALIVRPKILICDEPVSALDVSVQAQIINLLVDLQRDYGLSMIFIAHDLAVVRHISRRVMVMYLGKVMEQAGRDELFATPMHPYTRALLAAVPAVNPLAAGERRVHVLEGEVPSPANPPPGCVFVTRCPMADQFCNHEVPLLRRVMHGGHAACHYLAAPV